MSKERESLCEARAPMGFGEGCEKAKDHNGFHFAHVGCGSNSWPQECDGSNDCKAVKHIHGCFASKVADE